MLLLDITVVVVALPNIQHDLDASLTGLQWVVDAYSLTLAALILTAGALSDRYGRRLMFIVGVVVFTLSSLLCGVAWNIAVLDIARAAAGRRRGGALRDRAGADRRGVQRAGPRRRDRGLGRDDRRGRGLGAARRRDHHRRARLALGLLRQHPGRHLRPLGRAHQDGRVARSAGDAHRLWGLVTFSASLFLIVFGVLRGNAEGWSECPDPRLVDRRRRAARGLRARRAPSGAADARPQPLPLARLRRRLAGDLLHRRRDVRALPVPLDLPAGRARLLAARGRPALPAADGVRLRRAAADAKARTRRIAAAGADRRPGARRRRAAADARADAELALDRAATRPHRGRASASASRTRRSPRPRCAPSTLRARAWPRGSTTPAV